MSETNTLLRCDRDTVWPCETIIAVIVIVAFRKTDKIGLGVQTTHCSVLPITSPSDEIYDCYGGVTQPGSILSDP